MPVNTLHPDYKTMLPRWKMMHDVLKEEVKSKQEAYLPKTAGQKRLEHQAPYLYDAYLKRAEFQSFTLDSLRSMIGLVSRLEVKSELPNKIKDLESNATADGFGLTQLFSRVVENALSYGRQGLLVDFDHDGKPYLAFYDAFSIINWKSTNNNGRKDLTLVVLQEKWLKAVADPFSHDAETVYRVLELDEQGKYRVRIFNEGGMLKETKTDIHNQINYIPFVFIGSTDTSPEINHIPLRTMANCALKAYQLSADYYHDLHITCHPQAWVSGLNDGDNIEITGSNMIWSIPVGGGCGYLEISGTGIEANRQAIADQKNTAMEAGARVIDIGVESGEARQARQNDQHATLHSVIKVAASGINQALNYITDIMKISANKEIFSVTIDFAVAGIDATVLTSLASSAQAGKISWNTYWEYLRSGKLPNHDYEKETELLAGEEDNTGLKLNELENDDK